MRISSLGTGLGSRLGLAAVLLISSTVLAQRHEPSAPSNPPPSPPPQSAAPSQSTAPAPTPAPAASAAQSPASSASASRGSDSSAPAQVRTPENHVEPSTVQSVVHTSGSTFTQSVPAATAPAGREPAPGAERVVPEERIASQEKIAPAARIGENPPEKGTAKQAESDLRHRICEGGPCKEPVPKPAAESDLRHPVCPGGVCRCPAGQSPGKEGCVATQPVTQPAYQCGPDEMWVGGNCVRQGVDCVNLTARAEVQLSELRSLAAQVRDACSNDPASTDCDDAKARRDMALQRYRMLQNEAPPECRSRLQEPPL